METRSSGRVIDDGALAWAIEDCERVIREEQAGRAEAFISRPDRRPGSRTQRQPSTTAATLERKNS